MGITGQSATYGNLADKNVRNELIDAKLSLLPTSEDSVADNTAGTNATI